MKIEDIVKNKIDTKKGKRDDPDKTVIGITLSHEESRILQEIADENFMTVTNVLRKNLNDFLNRILEKGGDIYK